MAYAMTARQEKSQWCWAAVAYNVDHYFSSSSPWTQCMIAKAVLRLPECCLDPPDFEDCDSAAYLEDALAVVGRQYTVSGTLEFADIETEIRAGRPVCARIGWPGGGGHFVIIAGCRTLKSGLRQLWIRDPLFGPSLQDDECFRTAYHLCGEWTNTYLVR